MSGFPSPVLATAGSPDPAAPLVVLLHGRGIGRPVAESLRATMNWFREWLDGVAPVGRPVVLVGFSGGAAFGGGLLLDDPDRYAGAAILYGTLPFEAGVPTTPARLAGVPVVVAQGEHDTVIRRELLDRTWDYLLGESGAPTIARRDPVGHGIDPEALATLAGWLSERLTFLARRGRPAPAPATWPNVSGGQLPARAGPRPAVSAEIPQSSAATTRLGIFRRRCSRALRRSPAS